MIYEELEVNMNLLCNKADGTKQLLKVVRKGIDGLGMKSAVFESEHGAQFYCKSHDVPKWNIEPITTE